MPEPLVWAVVVNWNGRELLRPCLRTLEASDCANLAVAVVDNASTDGSQEMIAAEFPGVRLIQNEENLGYAAGVNAGLEFALGDGADYVFLLNNDVEVDAGTVAALVEAARSRPRAAFLGPMIYYAEPPDTIWSAGGAISWWTGDIHHIGLREKDVGQYTETTEVDYITACAVLVSAEAVRDIGVMDESYFMYNEDTDWCVRAARKGYSVAFVPGAKLWHKVSMSSGGGLTPFKIYHRLRSTLRFFSLYARPYHWLGIVPATALRTAVFAARQLAGGESENVRALGRGIGDSVTGRRRD